VDSPFRLAEVLQNATKHSIGVSKMDIGSTLVLVGTAFLIGLGVGFTLCIVLISNSVIGVPKTEIQQLEEEVDNWKDHSERWQ
jgi:hypothetical protein